MMSVDQYRRDTRRTVTMRRLNWQPIHKSFSPLPIDLDPKYGEFGNSLRSEKINLLEGDTLPLIGSGRALRRAIGKIAVKFATFLLALNSWLAERVIPDRIGRKECYNFLCFQIAIR